MRSQMKRNRIKDERVMTHLSQERKVEGHFTSIAERKKFMMAHFDKAVTEYEAEAALIDKLNHLNMVNSTSDEVMEHQLNTPSMRQTRKLVADCMPIRAFIYGKKITW